MFERLKKMVGHPFAILERWCLAPYSHIDDERRIQLKTMYYLYVGVVFLVAVTLAVSRLEWTIDFIMLGIISLFSIFLLVLVRAGRARVAMPLSITGYWTIVTILSHMAHYGNKFDVYRLTSVYLVILFFAELAVGRKRTNLIILALSVASLWGMYFDRALFVAPQFRFRYDIDDFVIASALLILAGVVSDYVLSIGLRLVDRLRHEAQTNHERAEELKQLQFRLAAVFDAMQSVLVLLDREGRILQWNRAADAYVGEASKAAPGAELYDVFPHLEQFDAQIKKVVALETTFESLRTAVVTHGEQRKENINVFPIKGDSTVGAVIRIHDVTERTRMERTMVQNEKMMSVGSLAVGMAHEINNPLGGILQNASVMKGRFTDDIEANRQAADAIGVDLKKMRQYMEKRHIYDMLNTIEEAGARAGKIVNNMLAFSRKSSHGKALHNMHNLVQQCVEMASTDYDLERKFDNKKVTFELKVEDGLPDVYCDATNMQQVVFNILRNGIEAMREAQGNGSMERHPSFQIFLEKVPGYLQVRIADNGPGIAASVQRRIFEPFFTTKEVGTGTGLGLSVSYFIVVENHGGEISVSSAPGSGAEFVLRLPA